jgi:hypothetical protein
MPKTPRTFIQKQINNYSCQENQHKNIPDFNKTDWYHNKKHINWAYFELIRRKICDAEVQFAKESNSDNLRKIRALQFIKNQLLYNSVNLQSETREEVIIKFLAQKRTRYFINYTKDDFEPIESVDY